MVCCRIGYWLHPNTCTAQSKQWKDVVYRAVEDAEDASLCKRFAGMSGVAAARYARIKNWGEVTEELAVMTGEIGQRGAQVIEPYLDGRSEDSAQAYVQAGVSADYDQGG